MYDNKSIHKINKYIFLARYHIIGIIDNLNLLNDNLKIVQIKKIKEMYYKEFLLNIGNTHLFYIFIPGESSPV